MTKEDLILELKKRCSFWMNNKTISKKHALECLLGIIENEESQPSLPSNLDEAANNYGIDIRLGYPRVMDETDRFIYNAFKAGAEWMAGQGVSMEITDETEWADVDTFVHRNCDGGTVIQIRKKEEQACQN